MKQQITKRAITESFRALLAVKPLDKITVRDIVEEIKKRLPVWKHQLFADGTREWSGCA